MLLTAVQWR